MKDTRIPRPIQIMTDSQELFARLTHSDGANRSYLDAEVVEDGQQ